MKPVKIYSIHFNRPEFIFWQYDSFKYHIKDQFEYIVINNARDNNLKEQINNNAKQLGLQCIETNSNAGTAGKHHIDSFNYIWQNYAIKHYGYSIMMDGDIFLIKDLNVDLFMDGNIFGGPKQQRNFIYHYLTPSIIIADIEKIPEPTIIDWEGIVLSDASLDTGGGLYLYFLKHPEVKEKIKELKSSWHIKDENNNKHCLPDELIRHYNDQYHIEFFGNEFLHYCRSSNWNYQSKEHHINKSAFVKNFVYATINGAIKAKEHNFQIPETTYFGWGK